MEDKKLYCPIVPADQNLNRVLNSYSIHMILFYYRTQKMHLSQQGMGIAAGLSTSTIARIESGKEANFSNILKYAHACGLQLDAVPYHEPPLYNAGK